MQDKVIQIPYGRGNVPLHLKRGKADWHVLCPKEEAPLPVPKAAFKEACAKPIASPPLKSLVKSTDRIVIVTSDGTRPVPNRQLIPYLLEYLHLDPAQVTVLLGNGTHRANTPEEIQDIFGAEMARQLDIVNHDAFDANQHCFLGNTETGVPVYLNRLYLEADLRIVLGFIEPHFFAGFSGGAKGVSIGVAGWETIFALHNAPRIAHPKSTWATLAGNPVREDIEAVAAYCPPEFLINVSLNRDKAISAIFAGDYRQAHRAGCEAVRKSAMIPVEQEFPLVISSNSGYPLDQNFYQSVKGLSAASAITEPGGLIVMLSECLDGIPEHGRFAALIRQTDSLKDLVGTISAHKAVRQDQWQIQIYADLLEKFRVALYSTLTQEQTEQLYLTKVSALQEYLDKLLREQGDGFPVAVLPDGPVSIPMIEGG